MTDQAIPAATLITVREAAGGPPELLMVERSQGMAFAAGALVFPGGRIDDSDCLLAAELGIDAAIIAAVRETIEETAVPVGLSPVPDRQSALELQQALVADQEFGALLREASFRLDGPIDPFARWVPRFHAVRRFDTMFYVAPSPPGQWDPVVIERECSGAFWLTAEEALEREQRGQTRLIFPTRRNLERLALHSTYAAIRADALDHPIEPVTPWVEERGGEKFITIPSHLGYPVTEERLDGLWRG